MKVKNTLLPEVLPPNGRADLPVRQAAQQRRPTIKNVPALQPPATGEPLVRGGFTSGSPGQIVRYANRWRENYNALAGLTIRRVRELLEQSQRGDTAMPQWTYRTIERRHPVLSALIASCESPLENFDWDVVIKKALPAGYTEAQATAQQKFLKGAYAVIDNLREAIKHLAHAEFRGYSHIQKHRADEGPFDGAITHLECLFSFCVCRDGLFGDWYWNPDSRQFTMPETVLTQNNRIGGDVLPREDFIIREVERPIDEIALENYVRRKLIEKDWSAFDEIFGIPSGVIIMSANVAKEDVAKYETVAREIAEGGSGALPAGSDYKPNEAAADGSNLFKTHLEQLNEDLVLAATGGKLTVLVEKGAGDKRGSSSTQENIFLEIATARAGQVSACFHEDFDKSELAIAFPGQPALVEFKLIAKDETDVGEVCTNVAAVSASAKPDIAWLNEKTGYKFVEAPQIETGLTGPTGLGEKKNPENPVNPVKNRAASNAAPKDLIVESLIAHFQRIQAQIEDAKKITDPDQSKAALAHLMEELDQLEADAHHDPRLANAILSFITEKFSDGMTAPTSPLQPLPLK